MIKEIHRTVGDPDRSVSTSDALSLLLEYSEWLDREGLIIGDGSPVINSINRKLPGEDTRSHSDLVAQFIEHMESEERGNKDEAKGPPSE